ncbi:DUF459 domain-containing protein [Chelativorans sp. AA-79]|uniref:SGNH/GDSL hydrolase family protein n=1 Tax=Chelativorans sp. AA-79 TaxID=3028735 RepID=UPI0023F777F4|nr:DUF459 domain-containing protein [Chelativorans sp. AA-79]WEX10357.1 DUF459 domain-containing protein [Chelativorans sp. AA-79]
MAVGKHRTHRFLRPLLVFGLAVATFLLPALQAPAPAQELIRRQGLLDRLFGGPPPREALPPAQGERPRRGILQRRERAAPRQERAPAARSTRRAAPRSSPARSVPEPPLPETVKKDENARVVLVVGDFMAGGLAEGLETAYAEAPGVRVVDRTNGSSGFVRDDFYDWNAELAPILEEEKPAALVVMIGSNDRQQLVVDGRPERPQTEAWRKEYISRVETFVGQISDAGIPLVWTGVPPFKSQAMSSDMLAFNDIYKNAVEAAGGSFVDIWEGFVDENGTFTAAGPDMNGQPVRLRASDGINLTSAGKRKIAFYVEKPLSKILGTAVSPEDGKDGVGNDLRPGVAVGNPADLKRTQPISLAGPDLDGGAELLGAAGAISTADGKKLKPSSQAGRADDFSLRQPETAKSAAPETTTAITP